MVRVGRILEVRNTLKLGEPLRFAIGAGDDVAVEPGEPLRVVGVTPDRLVLELEQGVGASTPPGSEVQWIADAEYVVGWDYDAAEEGRAKVAHAVRLGEDDRRSEQAACGETAKGWLGVVPEVMWRAPTTKRTEWPVPRCPECLKAIPLPDPWKDWDWPLYDEKGPAVAD